MRKFVDFSVELNKGIVSDSFWERHSSYLDCFGEIEDAEKQSLSHLSSQLFSGIDIRTQEKIIGRINVLHRLAFGNLTDLSVLYYELLHQIVQYKFSKEHISDWLPEIDHASKQDRCFG